MAKKIAKLSIPQMRKELKKLEEDYKPLFERVRKSGAVMQSMMDELENVKKNEIKRIKQALKLIEGGKSIEEVIRVCPQSRRFEKQAAYSPR